MNRRLLSCVVSAFLMAEMCACASAPKSANASPAMPQATPSAASSQQAEASTYKFTEGNIQFTVPAGWEVKPENGAVTVSPKAGSAQMTFSAVRDAIGLNSDERERLLNSLIEKQKPADVQLGIYQDSQMIGDMRSAARPFTGKNGGRDVNGMYMLLGVLDKDAPAEKYVFIVASSEQGAGESVEKGMDTLLKSIKKLG